VIARLVATNLWEDMIQQDMKSLRLKKEDADDRKKWRRKISVAYHAPAGRNSFKSEGDIDLLLRYVGFNA